MIPPVLTRPSTAAPSSGLAVVRDLFRKLEASGIVYCHWKSNEHLEAATRGATDLDVLVGRSSTGALDGLLNEAGYKRIAAVPARAYVGVEDFLAFDAPTGRLAHLHLHYRLVLGEKNLKGYRLPWEKLVLSSRRLDSPSGIFVADPNVELILLLVRAALKVRNRDLLGGAWDRPGLASDTLDEFLWLLARVNRERLGTLAPDLVGPKAAEQLLRIVAAGLPSVRDLRSFARAAAPVIGAYRTYQPFEAHRRRWIREFVSRFGRYRNRVMQTSTPVKHTLPRGGLIIAFLGSDGSGKSTVTGDIAKWLVWKLDVTQIYFGSGDGPASAWRWPLRLALALRAGSKGQVHAKALAQRSGDAAETAPTRLRSIWNLWWSVAIAREKVTRLNQARRARNLGMVAICDRYPQSQIMSFNDGPRLSAWLQHRSALLRAVARWELSVYRSADINPPDLVVKLHVTPEVAARRKPDMSNEELTRRVRAIKDLRFSSPVEVIEVDATQPLDRVLLEVKHAIWERL